MNRFEIERQKAIERVKVRGGDVTKVCKTASEFLDKLTDLFCEIDPNETTKELGDRLREEGVDDDGAVARVKAFVKRKLEESSENIEE